MVFNFVTTKMMMNDEWKQSINYKVLKSFGGDVFVSALLLIGLGLDGGVCFTLLGRRSLMDG